MGKIYTQPTAILEAHYRIGDIDLADVGKIILGMSISE